MRVVVGLGNPGRAYAGSRHNVGFAVVEELAERWQLALGRARDGVRMVEGVVADTHTMLVEPYMYMNLSGPALVRLHPPVDAAALIVIHDELDLQLGCLRVKSGGGTAGHHGLNSIVECFGSDFVRVRIGVGRPPLGAHAAPYVLSRFDADERETARAAIQHGADAVECVLRDGAHAAMNRFNVRRTSRPATAVADEGEG